MWTLSLYTQSAAPVTLTEAKTHLKVTDNNSDTEITDLIKRATALVESESNIDVRSSTWDWYGQFPTAEDKLYLPRSPISSITHIKYYAPDSETLTTWTDYYLMKSGRYKGWIQPKIYYPDTDTRPDAVTIRFVSGFTTAPEIVKQAILLAVGTWFENRESEGTKTTTLGLGFDRLIDQLRVL
jgi:uncharacterized phiE125 gp8 family phage protein